MSIDEGDIYGKRALVFNKRGDWDKQKFDIKMFDNILLEWDLGKKIPIIEEKMIRYDIINKI